MITKKPFGKTADGQAVDEYTITNAGGSILKVITYGGIVTELHVPDRRGKLADIVLGFNRLDQYLAGHPYFGCVVGRVAGRITGAKFTLDSKAFPLVVNDPPNHLHGGIVGWDKKVWIVDGTTANSVSMTYTSPDGEEGYPGKVITRMTYWLTDANEFTVTYEAVTDRATPIGPTNHSYFNLAGEGSGTIDNHVVQIHAGSYATADKNLGLLGRREKVTPANDFNQPRRLGDVLPGVWLSHGDGYFLKEKRTDHPVLAARVSEPTSGRVMTLSTTEPYVQLYSSAMMNNIEKGKSGVIYGKFAALCLEAHPYPDGVNHPELGDMILRPGQTYRQTTVHAFTTV